MSTERKPLLSDEDIFFGAYRFPPFVGGFIVGREPEAAMSGPAIRNIYEAARLKDAELIQMAVDALAKCRQAILDGRSHYIIGVNETLGAAYVQGFTPTPESK